MTVRIPFPVLAVLLACAAQLRAQQGGIPVPWEMKRAYDNETRSADGAPGPRHFSHRLRYDIEARLDTGAAGFRNAVGDAGAMLLALSTRMPGVPYPWPVLTVFHGKDDAGGMEYPMIVNNSNYQDNAEWSTDLHMHEVCHQYSPFLIGIDSVMVREHSVAVRVRRSGAMPVQVDVLVRFNDGSVESASRAASIWEDGRTDTVVEVPAKAPVLSVQLNAQAIPDYNRSDNTWRSATAPPATTDEP
jgi:hypothetical protein